MKIASTFPFKAALAAASIATIGVVALAMFDTEVEDRGVTDPGPICVLPRREPLPHPIGPLQPREVAPPPKTVASF